MKRKVFKMIRLELPNDCKNYFEILTSCISNNSNILYNKLKDNKSNLIIICSWELYKIYVSENDIFHALELCKLLDSQPDLVSIRNHEMKTLYTQYFSKKGTSVRRFYERIISNAKNPKIQCPFCGGISEPNELDHFLPKSDFGYYSIFPYNLIPICKDCNQIYKRDFYSTEKNEQFIHPYLDDNCFFNDQWLFAEIIVDTDDITLSTVKFYVNPPCHWSDDKKGKVKFHFKKLDLDRRFSTQSVGDLGDLIDEMIRSKQHGRNIQDFISERLDTVINSTRYYMNSWKKSLYQAMKAEINNIWNSI